MRTVTIQMTEEQYERYRVQFQSSEHSDPSEFFNSLLINQYSHCLNFLYGLKEITEQGMQEAMKVYTYYGKGKVGQAVFSVIHESSDMAWTKLAQWCHETDLDVSTFHLESISSHMGAIVLKDDGDE